MTDEPKRRSYAVDDVNEIAKHIKRIKDEEQAARDDLPSDTEPTALCERPGCDGRHAGLRHLTSEETLVSRAETLVNRRATLVKQDDGSWRWVGEEAIGCDFNAYWQPLIADGILSMVEYPEVTASAMADLVVVVTPCGEMPVVAATRPYGSNAV